VVKDRSPLYGAAAATLVLAVLVAALATPRTIIRSTFGAAGAMIITAVRFTNRYVGQPTALTLQ
jgi:hypothetical protein